MRKMSAMKGLEYHNFEEIRYAWRDLRLPAREEALA